MMSNSGSRFGKGLTEYDVLRLNRHHYETIGDDYLLTLDEASQKKLMRFVTLFPFTEISGKNAFPRWLIVNIVYKRPRFTREHVVALKHWNQFRRDIHRPRFDNSEDSGGHGLDMLYLFGGESALDKSEPDILVEKLQDFKALSALFDQFWKEHGYLGEEQSRYAKEFTWKLPEDPFDTVEKNEVRKLFASASKNETGREERVILLPSDTFGDVRQLMERGVPADHIYGFENDKVVYNKIVQGMNNKTHPRINIMYGDWEKGVESLVSQYPNDRWLIWIDGMGVVDSGQKDILARLQCKEAVLAITKFEGRGLESASLESLFKNGFSRAIHYIGGKRSSMEFLMGDKA